MESENRCYDFIHEADYVTSALRDYKECLAQWGLDRQLKINKFRVDGSVHADDASNILREFISCQDVKSLLEISGEASFPFEMDYMKLKTRVRSMSFFDNILNAEMGIVGPSGNIRGCYEEFFDGVASGDLLRDLFINPDSDNASVFSEEDKTEFIYRLFRLFVVGGAMCQPESNIQRYLDVTKSLYKELLILFRATDGGDIREASQIFDIKSVSALDLFGSANIAHSFLFVVVNHMDKTIISIKMEYKSYW